MLTMKKLILLSFIALYALSLKAQSYNVGHTSLTLDDPARNNRGVATEIYYPSLTNGDDVAVANGVFPYIVFGHGFIMGDVDYTNLSDVLVAKGYIVIFVTTCETVFSSDHETFGLDLSFICGQFYSLNFNQSSPFLGKIDNKKAIMGHSMGGGCTVLAAKNNANINTIICLSPMDTDPSSVAAAHLVNVPALIICATGDSVCPAHSMGKPIYDSLASNCKVFLNIKGGGHCLFGNNSNAACSLGESSSGSTITITSAQQNDVTLDFITPWLNYYLKNDYSSNVLFFDSLQVSSRITYVNECIITDISSQIINENNINCFVENDNLNLDIKNPLQNNISIQIFSLLGETQAYTVQSSDVTNEGSIRKTINISNLAHGMYIIKVSDRNKIYGLKFIK